MAQKILAGRSADPTLTGDLVEVKVDQVVLARAPLRALGEAIGAGLKKTNVETAVAYDGRCVSDARTIGHAHEDPAAAPNDLLGHGVLVARPGVGFAAAVHLERFASPARLCVTDEPRLAALGGIGMLTIVVPPAMLGQALAQGRVVLRPPRSVQIILTGRTRPFVCARDAALELVRRGVADVVRRVEQQYKAPVVLEFTGATVRLLSVSERAVLAAIAPQVGAAGAIFVSDERTEVFLRDQRRSKAHRALLPDAGAPCAEVINLDLAAVDPLLTDDTGQVRAVRELAGKRVSQVILGGDTGATLRDLFAAAALLKSKRVPSHLELLLAIPSRQMLEVLAASGALTDLVATGARIIEPDARLLYGQLYPAAPSTVTGALSARSFDAEPAMPSAPLPVVASAETLAYSVATGEIGDPRAFKRPVRVTVPRTLPTDDVLVVRERRADAKRAGAAPAKALPAPAAPVAWKQPQTLDVIDGAGLAAMNGQLAGGASAATSASGARNSFAVVCTTLDEVRQLGARAPEIATAVRAVVSTFIPSAIVGMLSGVGIAALEGDETAIKSLKAQKTIALPSPEKWSDPTVPGGKSQLTWLALGVERSWAQAGTARGAVKAPKSSG